MSSLVDEVLLALAAAAGRDGYAVPDIANAPTRRLAEQLVAAAGLTRTEPQPAIAAAPEPAWAGPTVLAETVVMPRQPVRPAPTGGSEPSRRYRGWDR